MRSNRFGVATIAALIGVTAALIIAGGVLMRHFDLEIVHVKHSDAVTTHGEWVKFANAKGDSIRAYVAYPERAGKAPAIIVIHEIYGLTEWEPTVADDFAKKGYIAIAPDLLSSKYKSTDAVKDSATKLVSALSGDAIVADLNAAYKYVSGLPSANADRIGVIGFCWGGGTVWRYASANPNLKAAVVCYGPLADTLMLNSIKAPVLGVYGQNDARVTASLPNIVRMMGALKKPFVADSYLGTGHGFMKPGRTGSGTPEQARAQKNIDAFFARYLDGK